MMKWREPTNRDMLMKVSVAFLITCVGGLVLDKLDFDLPDEIVPVAMALIVRRRALHRRPRDGCGARRGRTKSRGRRRS